MLRLSLLLIALNAPIWAQTNVLSGVFTPPQAGRGEATFAAKCARCHEGADVDGPPLTGDPFVERWREGNLASLFQFLKTRMPQDAPGSLDDAAYTDLVARILHANQYPPGNAELKTEALGSIQLVGHDGPKPLGTNTTVLAVGCVTAGANNTWMLTNAADLARTHVGDETSPEEMKRSAAKALGSGSYRLQNAPSPDAKKGHKVQVKGVLVRQANNDRINVLSFETLAPACAP